MASGEKARFDVTCANRCILAGEETGGKKAPAKEKIL